MIARVAILAVVASLAQDSLPLPDRLATPVPQLAQAFASYKFGATPQQVLRDPREDWVGARARAAADPAVSRWLAGRRAGLDAWIAGPGDDLSAVAGWGHDYVDAATGKPMAFILSAPEPPRGNTAAEKHHGAWVFYRRSYAIEMVRTAARFWRLTGEARYRDWAAAQLDRYADAYARWPVQRRNGVSRMMGQSLDEAVAAFPLVDAARLLGEVGQNRRRRWHEELFAPMLTNLELSNLGRNNIAVWQSAAAFVLADELRDAAARSRALDGPNGLRAMLGRGVLSDYAWFESSFGYANYTLRALGALFVQAGLRRPGALVRERLLAQDMAASLLAVRFADGSVPALGDTPDTLRAVDPGLLQVTQRTIPLRVGALPPSWDSLLDPVPVAPLPAETRSRLWEAAQFAMLRAGGAELFTHWGQRSASHAQGDALSWELRIGGTPVTTSAGTAAYGSRLFLDYLRRSVAHNMPMIDGRGQGTPGAGTLVSQGAAELTARGSGFPGDARVERRFRVSAAGAETRTTIRPADGAAHRLGELFTTGCAVTPAAPLTPAPAPAGEGFSWWSGTRASAPAAIWSAMLECGGARFALRWQSDAAGRVFVSQAPDATGAPTRTTFYFEATAAALETRLAISRR